MARDLEKQKAAKRAWYYRNKQAVLSANKSRRERNQETIRQVKSVPCMDCGITYPYYCMDFDHLDGSKKEGHVANMVSRSGNEKLKNEISKCEVVCSNCHRIRTHTRIFAPVG